MLEQTEKVTEPATTSVPKRVKSRLWEIDTLRGVAIVMMVVYHCLWDINNYSKMRVEVYTGFWWFFARTCATLFVTLSGVAMVLNLQGTIKSGKPLFPKVLKRAAQVFGCGMIITAVTLVFVPQGVIWFGILHVIGLSMLAAYPFLRLRYWCLPIGVGLMFVGFQLDPVRLDFPWLVWLGLKPNNFGSVDYFPFLPWFGVMLIGIAFGNWIADTYHNRRFLGDFSAFPPFRFLQFLGRHSLLIYMIHQPALITALVLTGVIDIKSIIR